MRTPRIGLAHELQHSFDVDKKVATYERTKNGILLMDIRAINTENRIRKVIGEPKERCMEPKSTERIIGVGC